MNDTVESLRAQLAAAESENARLRARVEELARVNKSWQDKYRRDVAKNPGQEVEEKLAAATARIAELERANEERAAGAAAMRDALTRCIGPGHRDYLTRATVDKAERALASDAGRALLDEHASQIQALQQDRARHEGEADGMRWELKGCRDEAKAMRSDAQVMEARAKGLVRSINLLLSPDEDAPAPTASTDGDKPVCATCKDTHVMPLGDREVMCTRCPTPCQGCRAGGNGPYCATTPCACACHAAPAAVSTDGSAKEPGNG